MSHSSLQAYWHLDDVRASRALLRLRFDECATQDYILTRPNFALGQVRVEDPSLRRCFICDERIGGFAGIHPPDSLEHAVLRCQHPDIVRLRSQLRDDLLDIATLAMNGQPAMPDAPVFNLGTASGDTELFALVRLQTALNPPFARVSLERENPEADAYEVSDPDRAAALRRRDQLQLQPDLSARKAAVVWLRSVLSGWLDSLHNCRSKLLPHETLGHRLASLVASFSKRLFDVRATIASKKKSVVRQSTPSANQLSSSAPNACDGAGRQDPSTVPTAVLAIVNACASARERLRPKPSGVVCSDEEIALQLLSNMTRPTAPASLTISDEVNVTDSAYSAATGQLRLSVEPPAGGTSG